ncbi:MAG: Gfo/Idh/MocA family oxidoreductase [Acidiferrobacterales bacterium]|nr:Gfo/Idh/MocA family oxidoreductase [Acidiferrobacterales bacterium]
MRKLRMGMVGGGQGAFIGAVHRSAAQLDGQIELVCGAFSSTPERSKMSGLELGLTESRCYPDYQTLLEAEEQLPNDERADFISIVTPNHLHFPVASAALKAGFHVICDKPVTLDVKEAVELRNLVQEHDRHFAVTYTYTGYPMVKEARARVAAGELGKVNKVIIEYTQGWLANSSADSIKQAEWRLDPARSGAAGCMGDIGVHAANLTEYICDDELQQVCSMLDTSRDSRSLDDDGTVLFQTQKGANGVLLASQICVGEENNLRIRVYGEKASLDWQQQEPNTLLIKPAEGSIKMLRAGVGELSQLAQAAMRTPAGHPEGYIEAFANLYRCFAQQIRASDKHESKQYSLETAPGIEEGLRGMRFIESVVAANRSEQKWHRVN